MKNLKQIEGYKAFDSNFRTFINSIQFGVKIHKHIDGRIKSGPVDGNGFNIFLNFEDVFRFADDNPIVCEVIGFGEIGEEYIDSSNEYDKIYACSDIYIKRIISREEIIEMAKKLSEPRLKRLITTYKMTDEEIKAIEESLSTTPDKCYRIHLKKCISYYQRGNKDAFK